MNTNELIGKEIKSIGTGRWGMAEIAFCIEFTDGTCVTIHGEHDENTVIDVGDDLNE